MIDVTGVDLHKAKCKHVNVQLRNQLSVQSKLLPNPDLFIAGQMQELIN